MEARGDVPPLTQLLQVVISLDSFSSRIGPENNVHHR